MIDESPALPLLVRANGRIEASERLAAWFGCRTLPQHLHGLAGPESGLPVEEAEALWDAVEKTRSSAAPLRMMLHPGGNNHALSVIGHLADPQVAGVGLGEAQARDAGLDVKTSIVPLDQVPRALAARDTRGLIKLVADRKSDRLLGGQIIAPEGSDTIQTLVMALKFGMTTKALGETIFPYLTTVEGLKLAAQTFDMDVAKLSCCAAWVLSCGGGLRKS